MNQPLASDALKRLEALVGEWRMEATFSDGVRLPGKGRTSFEWHKSGAHLVMRSTVDGPIPNGISVIGCDAANGTYYELYSDDRGVCRVYEMSVDDRQWRRWREGEPFSQRFTGTFENEGRTIVGRWEKAEDGTNFTKDFDLTYRRVR